MQTTKQPIMRVMVAISILMLVTSCAGLSSHHKSSSVVNYLYPDKHNPIDTASIPQLTLPLNVGIAFVPDDSEDNFLTENNKVDILSSIAKQFAQQTFVNSIQVIPSAYLRSGGSFTNLDQIKQMHNIDAIALVSYDQKQFTDEGFASFAYWTIIGAYIVPGEKNDTHTMVDAVVYDIDSRKLLFRAPGTSHIKGTSTPINLSEALRTDSIEGFKKASNELILNLESELVTFKQRVKNKPEQYKVNYHKNYSGAGSTSMLFIVLLMFNWRKFIPVQKREVALT